MHSRYERRQLGRIERSLETTGPGLATVLRGGAPPRQRFNTKPVRLSMGTTGVICVLVGATSAGPQETT